MHRTGLFGAYRLILALLVVSLHIGGVKAVGAYAVFGFYALSGYLMTLITQERYGFSRSGTLQYLINRIIRLFPLYIASILLTIFLITYLPSAITEDYHATMYLPASFWEWISNIFIMFSQGFVGNNQASRLTPPAWALTVEIFFYIAIGLGLSRNRKLTTGWFCVSVLYHVIVVTMSLSWWWKYFSFAGASLPFSTGALIYHYRYSFVKIGSHLSGRLGAVGIICLFVLNWLAWDQSDRQGVGFYLNYLIMTLALISCVARQGGGKTVSLDRRLGDFSYPVYLFHYQVGMAMVAIAAVLGYDASRPSWQLLALTVPPVMVIAWILVITIERPVERLRRRYRPRPTAPHDLTKLAGNS